MSLKEQSVISFSVRKSSRMTNRRVNYNEKQNQNSVTNDSIGHQLESKSKPIIGQNKSQRKSRIRTDETIGDHKCPNSDQKSNKSNKSEEKLSSSPTKIPKTSDDKQNICLVSKTKQLLSPSIVDSIVGRDSECNRIQELIGSHLKSRQAVSLYISGSAGTGKTLSVTHVMNRLRQSFDFKTISVNCMAFRNSKAIYSKILNEFKEKKVSKQTDCLQVLRDVLTDRKSDQMIVLVLDELDQLDTKSHDVLQTIFLWTKLSESKLILIGIANALDFTARVLSRIKAAIGLTDVQELHFMPYSAQQIVQIIEDRIRRVTEERNVVFDPMAIQLCARKIGSCSGDVRKALDVCRRALDLVESTERSGARSPPVLPLKASNDNRLNTGSPKKTEQRNGSKCVDIQQIMSVLNQVYGQKLESDSKTYLPFNQQIILCALLALTKHKNRKEVKLSELNAVFLTICEKRGISYNTKSEGECFSMCQLLEDYGFVQIKKVNQNARNAKLSLRVDESEVEHSLSDSRILNSILLQSSSYVS